MLGIAPPFRNQTPSGRNKACKEALERRRRGAPGQAAATTAILSSARGPETQPCSSVNQAQPKSTLTNACAAAARPRPDGGRPLGLVLAVAGFSVGRDSIRG